MRDSSNLFSLLLVLVSLVSACSQTSVESTFSHDPSLTPHISPSVTLTKTNIPTPRPTQTPWLTATPSPQTFQGHVFFDKNLSGEQDYEGEIPLEGITLIAIVNDVEYFATTDINGSFIFTLPHWFDQESLDIRFPSPNEMINPHNGHELTTVVVNLGEETILLSDEIAKTVGIRSYTRNKIDLFRASIPFPISITNLRSIGLSHGETTYWIPEFDLENTCILNYVDLNTNYLMVENYAGDTSKSGDWGKPFYKDKKCASQYGTAGQHAGIDTTYLPDSPRIILSPGLGIYNGSIATKFGSYIQIAHIDERIVEKNQLVYPGDIIGIADRYAPTAPHVHVEYNIRVPLINEEMAEMPYGDLFYGNHLSDDIRQKSLDESIRDISWRQGVSASVDFFWYELSWTMPDTSSFREYERCFATDEGDYCLMFYRGLGAARNYLLHPSPGVFAAGNELVPPEFVPVFIEDGD